MRHSSSKRALTVIQVRELGRFATQRRARGRIFDYDHGSFWASWTHLLRSRYLRQLTPHLRSGSPAT